MKALWAVLGVVGLGVLVAVLAFGSYVTARNEMVQKSAAIDQAFANIDVDLQRRAELVPELVGSVKGYVNVEENVLDNIAKARAGLLQAQTPDEKLAANDRLSVALLPFTRMQENYPQLKSNDQFMRLEDELAGSANRIAVARTRYNAAVNDYNVYIQQFPNSIWANMAGYHVKNVYYSADQSSRQAPTVDFSK